MYDGPGEQRSRRNTQEYMQNVAGGEVTTPHTDSDVFMRIRHAMLGIEWRTRDRVVQTGRCSQELLSLKPTNLPLKSASKTLYNPFPPTPQPHLTLHPQSSHGPPSSNRFHSFICRSLLHIRASEEAFPSGWNSFTWSLCDAFSPQIS